MKKLFGSCITLLFTISIGLLNTTYAMATEEPKFSLIEKSGDFELRLYKPMIVAETSVEGSLSEASKAGFRLIAGYIFGENKSRQDSSPEKIAMTAPVTLEQSPQKIAMTAPVVVESKDNRWRVHFVMPAGYTLTSLPIPNDSRVSLREIAEQKTAVIVFSGFAGEDKLKDKTAALFDWIKSKGLDVTSTPQLARYNPPWTLPFWRRNEVLINVK
ncbi:MAG: heme-binding protein [Pseudomonadota bacterium]